MITLWYPQRLLKEFDNNKQWSQMGGGQFFVWSTLFTDNPSMYLSKGKPWWLSHSLMQLSFFLSLSKTLKPKTLIEWFLQKSALLNVQRADLH